MKTPKKILFFRLDSRVGDAVVHSFFLRELKRLFPQTHITVATFAGSEPFFINRPYVDEVKILPKLAANGSYLRPAVLWDLFNMLVHCYTTDYNYIIVNPVLATWRNKLYCRLLPRTLWPAFDYTQHITHSYANLLRQLGARQVDTSYPNLLRDENTAWATSFLAQHALQPDQYWVINPVGSAPMRNLSLAQLETVLTTLKQAGQPVVLLDYKNQFAKQAPHKLRCTTTSILHTASLLAQAKGVITVDTGIVHLADCFAKKMLVLYAHDKYGVCNNHIFWASRQLSTQSLQGTDMVKDIPVPQIVQTLKKKFL